MKRFERYMQAYYNIPIVDSGQGYGGSRDYCLPTIPCAVTSCPCNKREKCEMPSNIKIGADGACKFGKVAMEMDRRDKAA